MRPRSCARPKVARGGRRGELDGYLAVPHPPHPAPRPACPDTRCTEGPVDKLRKPAGRDSPAVRSLQSERGARGRALPKRASLHRRPGHRPGRAPCPRPRRAGMHVHLAWSRPVQAMAMRKPPGARRQPRGQPEEQEQRTQQTGQPELPQGGNAHKTRLRALNLGTRRGCQRPPYHVREAPPARVQGSGPDHQTPGGRCPALETARGTAQSMTSKTAEAQTAETKTAKETPARNTLKEKA